MKDKRILYVSSEVVPYLAEYEVSLMSYDVPKMINDQGSMILVPIITTFIGARSEMKHSPIPQLPLELAVITLTT